MRGLTRLLVLGVTAFALPVTAAAQPVRDLVTIEGGVTLNHQSGDSGTVQETYVTAPGGTTFGWQVGGQVRIAPWARIGVEWSTTGTMSAVEPSRYFITYHEERRDRFLIVGFHAVVRAGSSVAFEPMAGLALTFPEAWSQAVYDTPEIPRPPEPRIAHELNTGVGPAFGLDVPIGRGRVTIVPGARVIRSAVSAGRYDATSPADVDITSIYPGGYPEWTTRGSLALRIGF